MSERDLPDMSELGNGIGVAARAIVVVGEKVVLEICNLVVLEDVRAGNAPSCIAELSSVDIAWGNATATL